MPGNKSQLALAAVLAAMFVVGLGGLIAVRTTSLDGKLPVVVFGALGMLAATGALVLGFTHAAKESIDPDD